jgi:cytochrome c-type biogenesis protein CcmH
MTIWVFWLAAVLLAAGVLALLLRPLLRSRAPAARIGADYDLAVYRDQLAELERDSERGLLSAGEARGARLEIERRILAAAAGRGGGEGADSRRLGVAVVVGLAVAAGAFSLYLSLGEPRVPSVPFAGRAAPGTPDLAAWADAAAREPASLEVQLGYAEALVATLVPGLAPSPALAATVARIRALDATHPAGLYYAGIVAMGEGRHDDAIALWQQLLDSLPADSPERPALGQQLDLLRGTAN